MVDFKDVKDILTNSRLVGGSLVGQGDQHFAGDFDEHLIPDTARLGYDIVWEIRNKTKHSETYMYKDLYQFSLEVTGSKVSQEGIDKLISPQGYPRSEDHSFDVSPKSGTTGNIADYEARIVKKTRPVEEYPPRMVKEVNNMYNYVEPTGQ